MQKRYFLKKEIKAGIAILSIIVILFAFLSFMPMDEFRAFKYKLITTVELLKFDFQDVGASLGVRISQLQNILIGLKENYLFLLLGKGAGSYFQYTINIPEFVVGTHPHQQVVTGQFQPHFFVNFLLLKSGVIGLILYIVSFVLILSVLIKYYKKKAYTDLRYVLGILIILLPAFFYIMWWSAKTAVVFGVLLGALFRVCNSYNKL